MAQLVLTEPEIAVLRLIGPERFLQARREASSGDVEIELVDVERALNLM